MAQSSARNNELHFRLFAKLLMFITLFLGLAIGYAGGFVLGQQNAMRLLYEGQQAADTNVDDLDEEEMMMNQAVADCYKETLGVTRYSQIAAGQALTTAEVTKVRPCENLKNK